MSIDVLVNLKMPQASLDHLAEHYTLHYWPDPADHERLLDDPVLTRIRAVQTNGSYGLKRRFIEAIPNLEIICAMGAGFENIDAAAAREHGIIVTHGPGTNSACVADQAFGLLLGVIRCIPLLDRGIREGAWTQVRRTPPRVSGKKLGIFGLGHIGMEMAQRGAGGFDMPIGYYNRRPRQDVDYRYFASLSDLAAWADILMVAAPGGPATRHVIDKGILQALGPEGYLVNIARGTVVDTADLIAALREGVIAGAGLDVIEGEPVVPDALIALENVVLSPHIGGASPETRHNMIALVRDNLDAHFAGKPVLTPIPA